MLSCAQAAFLRRGRRSPGFAGPWQSERGCRCSQTGINMRVYVRHTRTHTGIHMLTYIHRHTHKSTQAYTHICSHAYVCVCMSACIYCTHTHAHPHRPPSGYDSRSARQKACIISPCVVILDVQQLRLDTQPPDQHLGSGRGSAREQESNNSLLFSHHPCRRRRRAVTFWPECWRRPKFVHP